MHESREFTSRRSFLRHAAGLLALAIVARPRIAGATHLRPVVRVIRDELEHPDPRPGITAAAIPSNDALGTTKQRVLDAYDAARAHPEIFDGLACACGCTGKDAPHRSFLTCYETKQATGCGGCMEEGDLVVRLIKEGKNLTEIRKAVDALK
jgi:hypothetical protein